jgi:hypothetical protein
MNIYLYRNIIVEFHFHDFWHGKAEFRKFVSISVLPQHGGLDPHSNLRREEADSRHKFAPEHRILGQIYSRLPKIRHKMTQQNWPTSAQNVSTAAPYYGATRLLTQILVKKSGLYRFLCKLLPSKVMSKVVKVKPPIRLYTQYLLRVYPILLKIYFFYKVIFFFENCS